MRFKINDLQRAIRIHARLDLWSRSSYPSIRWNNNYSSVSHLFQTCLRSVDKESKNELPSFGDHWRKRVEHVEWRWVLYFWNYSWTEKSTKIWLRSLKKRAFKFKAWFLLRKGQAKLIRVITGILHSQNYSKTC